MRLTDNIRALVDAAMRDRGLSMNAVAKEIGINQPTLLRIYNGESRDPRRDAINKIARYFRLVSADDLYNANLTGSAENLLPLANSGSIAKSVESGNASTPARPSISDVDRVVSAALALLGMSLDEYLSARRSGNEVGLRSSRGHTSKTIDEQDAQVPPRTAGKVMKG